MRYWCSMWTAAVLSAPFVTHAADTAVQEVDSDGSTLSHHFLADANRAEYHGRLSEAIADVGKALTNSPHFGIAYLYRANLYIDSGRYAEALADLDRVAAMHPDAQIVFLLRARMAVQQKDGARALSELAHGATLPTNSVWHRNNIIVSSYAASNMYAVRSIAYELLGQDDAALDDLASALKSETERPWYILSSHCYQAAIAGLLDIAEFTCSQALERSGRDIGDYDSLGFVHLKQRAWAKAIADYDRALAVRPDLTLALYGRGLAKRAHGDRAGGDADVAAAVAGEPDIAGVMARLGVVAK